MNKPSSFFSDRLQNYLMEQAEITQKHAYAQGTVDNLWVQWNLYFNFCDFFEYSCLPAQTNTLVLYIEFLVLKLKSPKSVANYFSGVRKLHELLKSSTKSFEEAEVGLALRGVVNRAQHIPSPAKPMSPDILLAIKQVLDLSKAKHKVFWGLCLTAFFILARKSNLVPDREFNIAKQLGRCHVKHYPEQKKLTLELHWTKTRRPAQGPIKYTLRELKSSPLCVYSAILEMMQAVPGSKHDPLFMWPDNNPVTYRQFMKHLRESLVQAGIESKGFSTHSFRSGGATWAFNSGVPGEIIKILGDWRSDCYFRYLEISDEARDVASQLFAQHLIDTGF